MSTSYQDLSNAIRILSIDAIEKANSGHPGAPMGMADIATVLWKKYLRHNPNNPKWINRDRFVLSNGHASMLIYSLLHLTGYNLSIQDLKKFRQLDSKTPGHPEYFHTVGIESTTGPLGQGLANAVGFAIAEKTLSAQFNKKNYNIIDHYTYVFVGDGCMMEGISHEACSLAGTLKLNKLIVLYDRNRISIDGKTNNWYDENTAKRFEAYHWHVIDNIDGHNFDAIKDSIKKARLTNQPSLLIFNTIIGFGSPNKANTSNIHGAPLGEKEIALVRKKLNCEYPPFHIPKNIYLKWNAKKIGELQENEWKKTFFKYTKKFSNLSKELCRRIENKLPNNWKNEFLNFVEKLKNHPENISTRLASNKIIEKFGNFFPEFLGGSADLAPSNLTIYSGTKPLHKFSDGNYIHYGVREFGMTAIANGISLYGGFLPYSATFLTFMDYAKNAVRMASLMKLRHIMIYTHDSIGLGEDGPTHQPIEQITSLRNIPNMNVWRPCDQIESAFAWKKAIEYNGPTALIFSRQNLVQQKYTEEQLLNIERGGYILKDSKKSPELILIATGSEVEIAISVSEFLNKENYNIRVVSMPSTNIFEEQNDSYKNYVLPKKIIKIAIEAASSNFWYKYVGLDGYVIGIDKFGISAPADKIFKFFGFTIENILKKVKNLLLKRKFKNIKKQGK